MKKRFIKLDRDLAYALMDRNWAKADHLLTLKGDSLAAMLERGKIETKYVTLCGNDASLSMPHPLDLCELRQFLKARKSLTYS